MSSVFDQKASLDQEASSDADHVLDPTRPVDIAHTILESLYNDPAGRLILHYYSGGFVRWSGTHYELIDKDGMRATVYAFLDASNSPAKNGSVIPFKANAKCVSEVIDALQGASYVGGRAQFPCWLAGGHSMDPAEIIACKNGLLHVRDRRLLEHTPYFFNAVALPYSYDPNAAPPVEWFKFLKSLWSDDSATIDTLQEIFGYFLTNDTSQQKIFAFIGPTRAGKGVIHRTLEKLLGAENVVYPTPASLTKDFGLAPLIGKPVAIFADARFGGRSDQQAVAERLLSISGEDGQTISRKYIDAWTGRLTTRFLIISNELPRFGDASGALAKRFVILTLKRTFYDQEDIMLEKRFSPELPGILNWALEGRDRLIKRGHFVQPSSSAEVVRELEDLGSPISAFLRERCDLGEGFSVEISKFYETWRNWCMANGRDHPGNSATLGRDLRSAFPALEIAQPRDGDIRKRVYLGLKLKQ